MQPLNGNPSTESWLVRWISAGPLVLMEITKDWQGDNDLPIFEEFEDGESAWHLGASGASGPGAMIKMYGAM